MRPFLHSLLAPFRRRELTRALAEWIRRRPELETQFLDLARASGKPQGLSWTACDWTGAIRFARERTTGLLTAFAGVVIHFEADEGGGMEGVEAVPLPRDATALFHYRHGWGTGGRALFNMSPPDALERLKDQFDPIE
jgi:hypothetical protein